MQTNATLLANNSQRCWMLHIPSVCLLCYMLLRVVESCCAKFETGQTLSYAQRTQQLPTLLAQQCWELLCPLARSFNQRRRRETFTFYGELEHKTTISFFSFCELRYSPLKFSSRKGRQHFIINKYKELE